MTQREETQKIIKAANIDFARWLARKVDTCPETNVSEWLQALNCYFEAMKSCWDSGQEYIYGSVACFWCSMSDESLRKFNARYQHGDGMKRGLDIRDEIVAELKANCKRHNLQFEIPNPPKNEVDDDGLREMKKRIMLPYLRSKLRDPADRMWV